MFEKILIANRGEIACRVIRTANELGIKTVAVYSDIDQSALHVKQADEAIHIGAAPSSDSYLRIDRVIDAAIKTGAQAIHPGYGFLSENAEFAKACADANLVFIGPPANAIQSMGSKSASKRIMQEAGIPLVPGYHGNDQSIDTLKQAADEMGYPVLLKAVAGGGGKGMRQIWSEQEFQQGFEDAKREAIASFGNGDMLVEKYLTQPRHVEVQVFCDQHGNGVYLFERDCSVQRRHQKIIEEAPAPGLDEDLRKTMGETAVKAAQAINYVGAGTVEYLLDTDGSFYFMEMNTRLQVEHPVTEMITGQDLVEWQFQVANGDALPCSQNQLSINGHAFEARIYAEDPRQDFLPTTGTLKTLKTPQQPFARVDTGVIQGDVVSPFYDPMIAKLVVHGDSREQALTRLASALRDYRIDGVTTNTDFLHDLATHPAFQQADLDTGFIEKHRESLFAISPRDEPTILAQAALYLVLKGREIQASDPWSINDSWRLNYANTMRFELALGDGDTRSKSKVEDLASHSVSVRLNSDGYQIQLGDIVLAANAELEGDRLTTWIDGHRRSLTVSQNATRLVLFTDNGAIAIEQILPDLGDHQNQHDDTAFKAPMNGTVIELMVDAGARVKAGQALVIMEAMKMQHTMTAPTDGVVDDVFCSAGELVDGGSTLLTFNADESES